MRTERKAHGSQPDKRRINRIFLADNKRKLQQISCLTLPHYTAGSLRISARCINWLSFADAHLTQLADWPNNLWRWEKAQDFRPALYSALSEIRGKRSIRWYDVISRFESLIWRRTSVWSDRSIAVSGLEKGQLGANWHNFRATLHARWSIIAVEIAPNCFVRIYGMAIHIWLNGFVLVQRVGENYPSGHFNAFWEREVSVIGFEKPVSTVMQICKRKFPTENLNCSAPGQK